MAIRTLQVITDDHDGTELKPGQGQTISFSFDGKSYEIDLSDKNVRKLPRRWIRGSVRRTGTPSVRRGRSRARAAAVSASTGETKSHSQAVREWAQQNGLTVSARGRIASSILESYAAAH